MALDLKQLDRSALEAEMYAAYESGDDASCLERLDELILLFPLEAAYFDWLSRLRDRMGQDHEALVARKRHAQLLQIEDNTKPSPSVDRLRSLWAHHDAKAGDGDVLELEGFRFGGFRQAAFGDGHLDVGTSTCGEALIKLCREPRLWAALEKETSVFRRLSEAGCVSAPALICSGETRLADSGQNAVGRYQILSYRRADRGGFGFPDLVLALLEQQAAGIYNGALTIRNLRYDSMAKVCRFSSYESALRLSEAEQALSPIDYLEWCEAKERERVAQGGASSFLLGSRRGHDWIWDLGRLNLRATQLLLKFNLMRIPENCCQTVDTSKLFLKEGVDWTIKLSALKALGFEGSGSVLDVGCGLGAATRALNELGCRVTGLENDPQQITAAQIISNIEGKGNDFRLLDLDYDDLAGKWDDVLLLNSFQHFVDPEAAARRIDAACGRRIYLESGLSAQGYKWVGRWYRRFLAWEFADEVALKAAFGKWFPQFAWTGDAVPTLDGRKLYCLERKKGR